MANSIVISSGHGGKVAGAIGILNEHNEAVRVVEKVAEYLRQLGVNVSTFHDNTSTTQAKNLSTIVNFHNSKSRELDISVHFNAASRTDQPRGTECLYYDNSGLAASISGAIAGVSGLKNRGPKQDKGLYFLSKTKKPAVLIEVCFVDSSADANIYNSHFDTICKAIAETVAGRKFTQSTPALVQDVPKPVAPHKVGDMVTLQGFATNYATGQIISQAAKGKAYKIIQVKPWVRSNSKVAYLLSGIMSWVLEQDVR